MRVSVVIRTRNEAARLWLVLTSVLCQTMPAEVVVANDASTDATADVLDAFVDDLRLVRVDLADARGRAGASNAGAQAASGDVLLFMDGDTLLAPTVVAAHAATHSALPTAIGRGETWHLRCTRDLLDPETGLPKPEQAARVAVLSEREQEGLRVTRAQIRFDFSAVARRAQPGVYPGHGPRRLHELEMDALRRHPGCPVLWAAASGSNLSVARSAFMAAGGFDEALDINEHRELALRLSRQGGRMVAVEDAPTYHLIHRSGWRDPLVDTRWYEIFHAAHPIAAVRLLPRFWSGLADGSAATIASLPDLAEQAAAMERAAATVTDHP